MKYLRVCAVICLPVLTSAGCGSSNDDKLVPVSGRITLKGKPLVGAEVHFALGTREGFGTTDEDGRYRLVRGAPVGNCKVYITKETDAKPSGVGGVDTGIEGMDATQQQALDDGNNQGGGVRRKKLKPLIPLVYSDPEKSKLTFEVPPGGSDQGDFTL